MPSAPSLYDDDDDIVTKRRRSSSRSSSSSSSSGHHHHHHHSSANANYQKKFDESVGAEIAARRMMKWAVRIAIYGILCGAIAFLWNQNVQMRRTLANYEGTNAVLASELSKAKAERDDLLLQVQTLENDNAEQAETNRILLETLDRASGKIPEGAEQ